MNSSLVTQNPIYRLMKHIVKIGESSTINICQPCMTSSLRHDCRYENIGGYPDATSCGGIHLSSDNLSKRQSVEDVFSTFELLARHNPNTMKSTTDHRPRVNAERSAKMRRRLIEAAMLVFAEKGIEHSQIDDVMTAANVSRGGFYGHFRSMSEILAAIGEELGNELIQMIEMKIEVVPDPAERIARGLLLYMRCTQDFPQLARFIAATGVHVNNPHNLVYEHLPRHIEAGNTSGRLAVAEPNVALDLIAGTMFLAVSRAAIGQAPASYQSAIIASILMGLGMPRIAAGKLARLTVDPIDPAPDTLLVRSHQRKQSLQRPA